MKTKTNRDDIERKQVAHGMCYGDRYNPKTGKIEKCQHRDECQLYHQYEIELDRRNHFTPVIDYVGGQYIKDWRKCKIWKTHKSVKNNTMNPNSPTIINHYEEELERKRLMDLIQAESSQLAAHIAKMEVCSTMECKGAGGSLELHLEVNPKIQEIIDQHTKRWQGMVDEHNKKFGLNKIMM